ncbi:acyl-CoA dehydrogenase family protein [Spirillospora sp. CA-294931]|uniref:acyl-CoA dehydrogenase family protein n=1 Tax=Spirillospora sp. CA-294931 TaxID=3240042 RepID=UPI003D8F8862
MRFAFTEDQRLFGRAVRDVLGGDGPVWQALADVGLLGAHVPEEYGGLGLTPVDTVLAYEETGRFAVTGPVVETAVVAPPLVPADRLPGIVAGGLVVSARPGTGLLPHADTAALLVVEAGRDTVVVEPEKAVLTPRPSIDPSRPMFADDLPSGSVPGAAFDHAAVAVSAQLVGLGRRLCAETVAYAGRRHQFGRAVGSFQAVKHRLADVAVGLEFAAPLVYKAAFTLSPRDVSAAKVAAGRAAHQAARAALQVHGAIGYTEELDLHRRLKRVWALRTEWGDERFHKARIRAALYGCSEIA